AVALPHPTRHRHQRMVVTTRPDPAVVSFARLSCRHALAPWNADAPRHRLSGLFTPNAAAAQTGGGDPADTLSGATIQHLGRHHGARQRRVASRRSLP